jgi:hydrogenase maturation protease
MYLFASTHIILQAVSAEFISQMDPPAELKQAAASCVNLGVWPILVGDGSKGEHDVMLSSPIILYDYPKLAPESPGPLFDGTEIDEILTLRIQTMTDEEKREMRGLDEHARRLLERTEALPQSALSGMHGTIRNRQPSPEPTRAKIEFDDFFGAGTKLEGVWIGEVFLRPGHRVRLRPRLRADVMDIAIAGRVAVVEAVEQDLEHKIHLAVVLEDDPGKDLGFLRQPGHRFFYGIDEVELLREEMA